MSTQVLAALLAAFGSLGVAVFSLLKTRQLAEDDARRTYEYEARQRLYAECEPILFEAVEVAQDARGRIEGLARSARAKDIRPDGDGWLTGDAGPNTGDGYYFKSTLFLLLVPLTAFKLLQRRLTVIDLALERRIWTQYELLKVLFLSFARDFDLARGEPELPYKPDSADPGKDDRERLLRESPAEYARQGFYRLSLERIVESFVTEGGEPGGRGRPKTFDEFSRNLGTEDSKITHLIPDLPELFRGFHPARKPVLWRVLLAQEILYDVLLRFSRNPDERKLAPLVRAPAKEDLVRLRWLPPGNGREEEKVCREMIRELQIASEFVRGKLDEIDERLEPPPSSRWWSRRAR